MLTVSPAVAFVISLMDGSRSRAEIQAQYMRRFGRLMFTDELDGLVEQLDRAWFLEGPALRRRIDDLTEAYRSGSSRPIRNVESLGAQDSLSALGYTVGYRRGRLCCETNYIAFGSEVAREEVKIVALRLIQVGIEVKLIRPFGIDRGREKVIEVLIYAPARSWPPRSVQEIQQWSGGNLEPENLDVASE